MRIVKEAEEIQKYRNTADGRAIKSRESCDEPKPKPKRLKRPKHVNLSVGMDVDALEDGDENGSIRAHTYPHIQREHMPREVHSAAKMRASTHTRSSIQS